MTDITYSELTERYWIMVNGSRNRDITEYMKEHDAKVREDVIEEILDAIRELQTHSVPVREMMGICKVGELVEQLKEKKE